jgi:5,10-methylene-tetrahydrofolate dehydrogenase/methenyl tetrahydrofolate cyclohydrolase
MLKRLIYAIILPLISVLTVAILAISLGYIFYNLPTLGSGEGELRNLSVVLVGMSILIGTPLMSYLAVKYIK